MCCNWKMIYAGLGARQNHMWLYLEWGVAHSLETVIKTEHNQMTYLGPPPPSGTVQSMYSDGILIEHALQWRQFWALISSLPCSS